MIDGTSTLPSEAITPNTSKTHIWVEKVLILARIVSSGKVQLLRLKPSEQPYSMNYRFSFGVEQTKTVHCLSVNNTFDR